MAAITGFLQSYTASDTRPPVSRTPCTMAGSSHSVFSWSRLGLRLSSSPNTLPPTDKSMPAQNARPAPVTTTAPTASSALARL